METENKDMAARDAELTEELLALSKKNAEESKKHFEEVTNKIKNRLSRMRTSIKTEKIKADQQR